MWAALTVKGLQRRLDAVSVAQLTRIRGERAEAGLTGTLDASRPPADRSTVARVTFTAAEVRALAAHLRPQLEEHAPLADIEAWISRLERDWPAEDRLTQALLRDNR